MSYLLKDSSLMPFGKFTGDKMANVPDKYLLWLYDQLSGMTRQSQDQEAVKGYIEDFLL